MGLEKGEYTARGVSGQLGRTNGGKEQIAVELVVTEGDFAGQHITWFGYFTEKTWERTLESLRLLGWEGDDLDNLVGIDRKDVRIVCDEEEYNGVTRVKVQWINGPGGIALKDPLTKDAARTFAQKMKGKVVAHRQKMGTVGGGGAQPNGDDIPF